ncbi:MAG TPA: type III secretion system export apparatus subunit SctR [Steroidobacteraceae bacterium]|jgi:type III secretion protein R|nr:type III secretion system export apparatus subunit SctR [Steroidobacteraceae bacterium]
MSTASDPFVIAIVLGLLALAPVIAIMVTSFAKLIIVMGLARNALGLQQVPPNLVLNGLALVLSMYVMAPIGTQMFQLAEQRTSNSQLTPKVLFEIASSVREPLREFLGKHAQPRERQFFVESAVKLWPAEQASGLTDKDLMVLVPAFTVSELTAAFKIGFLLYLAFVVIDLVVANVLVSLGMMMFSPTVVSIPLKLLLFVLLDGWSKLIHGLILTYR